VSATEYGAAALILLASGLALLPREIRTLRADDLAGPAPQSGGEPADDGLAVPTAAVP
jgi:hypothetical protein